MREIPKKNYFIVLIIMIAVVCITIFLAHLYNTRYKKISIMYQYLQTINIKDLDTYILEKPSTIVYLSNKYKYNDKLEKKLKKSINELNVSEYFVYLDINEENDNIIEKINQKFNGNLTKQIPVLIVFEEGKIKESYYDLENIDIHYVVGDLK